MTILQPFKTYAGTVNLSNYESLTPSPTYQDFSSCFYLSTANRIFHSFFFFLPTEGRPTYLPTHPIYYFMKNIFDCPNLLLSATEDLNHIEVCWSLAGPERRAKCSYTYPIHIQPYLSHHMYPGHVIPCHVIFHIM